MRDSQSALQKVRATSPKYDLVFITHLPAFYKVNLYNQLAKRINIFVIFVASSSTIRTKDFVGNKMEFDFTLLHTGNFETRPKLLTLLKLLKLLAKLDFSKVVVGGWDLLEFWVTVLICSRSLNAITVESTIVESVTSGIKLQIKKFFISRIGVAFPSGKLHQDLLNSLAFQGTSYFTRGVGIFNRDGHAVTNREFSSSFLYVGRLSPEKNLKLLVEAFKVLPDLHLTVVGAGPMEAELRDMVPSNVSIRPYVPNSEIAAIYRAHDVFILPSLGEPWGLVVDEALYYGLPVIVSKNVGCHTELVEQGVNGLVFDPHSKDCLIEAIKTMSRPEVYATMRANVALIDFARRDEEQLLAYQYAVDSSSAANI